MEHIIFKQIEDARQRMPGLDGVIHGVRNIKQGKHGSRSSLFYSQKNQAFIPVESTLERKFCYQLEADSNVACYRAQSLTIPYFGQSLYPDFLIFDKTGNPYVREVKHSAFIDTKTNFEKIAYLKAFFSNLNFEYGVVTEKDMWPPIEQSNWAMLYDRGGRLGISKNLLDWLISLVKNPYRSTCDFSFLREKLRANGMPFYLLEAALFIGALSCCMTQKIHFNTLIEVAK